jgi:hypothetical protein
VRRERTSFLKKRSKKLLFVGAGAWSGVCAVAFISNTPLSAAAAVPTLAVLDFSFADTSGEMHDQSDVHAQRLSAFMRALRQDVSSSGHLRLVPISCGSEACKATSTDIVSSARAGGAEFLLLGGLHKMSTLVQWMKVTLIALPAGATLLNTTYTFRGDNDLAWEKAENFVAADVAARLNHR